MNMLIIEKKIEEVVKGKLLLGTTMRDTRQVNMVPMMPSNAS